ncbi:MAG TPA: hypothetical protein PLG31_01905 [Spirochaetota bacterium]|nr:hypothetical protein [Spirochaetota bacterium]
MSDTLSKYKWRAIIGGTIAVISYMYFFAGSKQDPVERKVQELSYYKPRFDDSISLEKKLLLMGLIDEQRHSSNEINDYLLFVYEEHGKDIHRPWGQYWAANKFESYCTKLVHDANPEGTLDKSAVVDCIYELSRSAFPGHGDAIFSLYHKMQMYNNWLRQNSQGEEWNEKSPRDRARAIWDKRYELLGVEATEEIFAQRLTMHKTADALDSALDASGSTIEQKIDTLKKGLSSAFGDDRATSILSNEKYYLTNRFLQSPDVQRDLSRLDNDERVEALAEIRRNLGFSEEEIARLAKRDAQIDQEWRKGLEYMKKIEEYKKTYKSGELQAKIQEARKKYFGASRAIEIESEERRGVYRYKSTRTYGL